MAGREKESTGRITPLRDISGSRDFFSASARQERAPERQRAAPDIPARSKSNDRRRGRQSPRTEQQPVSKRNLPDKRSRGRPQPKPKKHLPKKLRVFLTVFGFFCALLITAFVGIFLVFKVDNVELTGDQLYSKEDIMKACDYSFGDNLFFLSTTDKEQQLPIKLPYIGSASITRKIPGTITISLTAAVPAGQFQNGEEYILVDDTGKVLDKLTQLREGVMQVVGAESGEQNYGKPVNLTEADKEAAYKQIMEQLKTDEAILEITRLDLTDVHNISMIYQNRITMNLGGAADIAYKIQFGINVIRNRLAPAAKGTLGLELSPETGKTSFAEDRSKAEETPAEETPAGENTTPEKKYNFASNPDRGSDIPDTPYTGSAADSDSADNGDNGGSDSGENNGDNSGEDTNTPDTDESPQADNPEDTGNTNE